MGEAFQARVSPSTPTPLGTLLRRHFERILLGSQLAVDAAAVFGACIVGFVVRQYVGNHTPWLRLPAAPYYALFFWVTGVSLVTFAAMGMYSTRKSLLNVGEFERLGKSTLISFLVVNALIFLLRSAPIPVDAANDGAGAWLLATVHKLVSLDNDQLARGSVIFAFAFLFLFVAAERFVFFKIIQEAHRRGIGHHHVLIVGAGPTGQKIREKLLVSPTIGWSLRGFVDDDPSLAGARLQGVPVLGTTRDLESLIAQNKVRTVFASAGVDADLGEDKILEIVRRCRALSVEVCVVPRLWHLLAYPVQIDRLDSIPLIVPRRTAHRSTLALMKRSIDVAVASLGLLVASPLILAIAILIRRESNGPAFFRQKRVGKGGRLFPMLKFRTMHLDKSGDAPKPRDSGDPRVTRIGRWLRRTSLDEVPQLWNVLVGDMSLVGPRPEMPFIVAGYSEFDRARLSVKPGITGLWQISYARYRPIHANLDYDLYYVEHQSLLLDLVILFLTPFAMVKGTGAV